MKRGWIISYKPLADMVAPSIKDWKGVAENTKVSFQKRMKKEYNSGEYETHPPFWFTKKVKGKNVKIYAEDYPTRKSKGKATPKGTSQISRSKRPDLTLTGKMLQQINASSTGTSAKLEWTGHNAVKINSLDKRGKFPMFKGDEPASSKVRKDIDKYVNELYDKRVKAQTQRVVFKV